MAKQEEIRKGIIRIILLWQNADTRTGGQNPTKLLKKIQEFEVSQGVVIKVDRKLPSVTYTLTAAISPDELMIIEKAYRKAYAGFGAVEPLIKEVQIE